ncbi:hypothetical protein IRT38_01130 (plasmid) [Acinetobacter sp. SK-43]|uniref:hypothetical protein n=1 Tax=Acinetobacter sp. SK-43 TaxID=2785295 RepID=UPI00188CD89E|nr:hypothetical protein [Acinetobacter sp. SK-43]MBF4454019.1 hypothetical protein [Acinetobacter sp. SK-43]
MSKIKVKVVIGVTKKEFEAISFFRSEVTDKVEGSSDEAYVQSIEAYTSHYTEFTDRLFASKSNRIEVFEHELVSFRELRHEAAGKIDGGADEDYIAEFELHDKQLTKLRKKFEKAKSKATVEWALAIAKERLAKQGSHG